MSTLGERIRELRGDMQQIDLARRLEIHPNTLMRYEKGGACPDVSFLQKLLEIFPNANPDWLLTGTGDKERAEPLPEGFTLFPRYEISAGAGPGRYFESEQVVDFVAFKDDWVINYLRVPRQYLALLTVKGDSMSPTLNDGDLILVDMRASRLEDSAIYVLEFEDALLVKRVQRKLDGTVVVKSDNPLYEPEILEKDKAESLRIVGRVVWAGKKL